MERDFDDLIDNEDLQREIEDILENEQEGLSGQELYARSRCAEERSDIASAVATLRAQGRIVARDGHGGKRFLLNRAFRLGAVRLESTTEGGPRDGTLAMVPLLAEEQFRCMVSPEGTLILTIQDSVAEQRIELSPQRVVLLWQYLAKLYPHIVLEEESPA